MHHTSLDDRARPGRLDRLWEADEPVAADHEHIFDAAVGQLGAHTGPTISSRPPSRRDPFGTSCGIKLPLRSRGTANSTSPTWLETIFGVVPLREFGNTDDSGAPRS